MEQFKEMIIQKTPNGTLPQLPLNGQWLRELGFTVGRIVNVTFNDSCLTLTTHSTGNNACVLSVTSKRVRGRSRPQLIIDGFLLKRYGIDVGDRVGLHLAPNRIQISKINTFTTAQEVA